MNVYKVCDLSDVVLEDVAMAAIGSFDFVHLGHQRVLKDMLAYCGTDTSVVITVDSHPNKAISMPIGSKVKMFEALGVEVVIILEMASVVDCEAVDFVGFLKCNHIRTVFVGNDFCFGKNKSGDVSLLEKFFELRLVEFVKNGGEKISSSSIRKMLDVGDLESFKSVAGYNYMIESEVVLGNQIGRTIGFNTANLECGFQSIRSGVYVTNTCVAGVWYRSVTNVGFRPTIGDGKFSVETHILDFDQDIYGLIIKVEFLKMIRAEQKFSGLEQLKNAISEDLKYAKFFEL